MFSTLPEPGVGQLQVVPAVCQVHTVLEAVLLLRLEKGYLHVGADTDGTTTPADVGWGEIAGMGAMMLVTVVILLLLAARVFQAGIVNQLSMSSLFGRRARKD